MMSENVIAGIIAGLPNLAGFIILSYVLYLIVDRQLTMLETMIEDCIDSDTEDESDD